MAYTDLYEEWKAQGRPGGDFNAWQASQGGGAPQAAPQPQAQPYSQPQPVPQATQGPGNPWNGQGAPPPSSVPGLEQAFATQRGNTDWRDTNVSGAQWGAWEQEERQRAAAGQSASQNTPGGCPPDKPFTSRPGPNGQTTCAYKPDDCPEGSHVVGSDTNGSAHCVGGPQGSEFGAGGGGSGGGGGAGGGGGFGGAGGVPQFNAPRFTAPSYADAMNDPGYQFALGQANQGLQHSQAAQGLLRTGGSLKDLLDLNQQMGAQQYQNVYNRAANTYGLNYQAAKDEFAPQYGGWQTQYGGDLSRWTTGQNVGLQKYLQQQQNIYGLVNQPMSPFPTFTG